MKRLILRSLTLIFAVALAFGLGWFLRNDKSFFVVEKTPFTLIVPDNHIVVAAQLRPQFSALVEELKSQNIWQVNIGDIRKSLLANNWVKSAKVQRRFPNQINFEVDLEEAALIVVDDKNHYYPLTASGKLLAPAKLSVLPDRPITRDTKLINDKAYAEKLSGLFQEIPDKDDLQRSNISEVTMLKPEGLTLFMHNGVKIHLGETNIQTKALQVLRVIDYLKSQRVNARVIDASFNKKVVVRQR